MFHVEFQVPFFFLKEGTQTWTNVLGKQRPSLFLFLLCSPFHLGMAWLTYNSFCLLWVCLCTWIHYLACEVFIYLAKVLLCWTFWPFPWTILWQEINVLFKWFISFSINLGNKIKLTFSKNKGAVGCENIYLEIKICVYLEFSFCWKTNIIDLQKKKRRPLLTHAILDWWCCLGWATSEMAIREQTGWVLFNKIPLKKKKSQNSRNCLWNLWNTVIWVHSLKHKENGIVPWSRS